MLAALGFAAGAIALSGVDARSFDARVQSPASVQIEPSERFAQAPFGVDATVTGPVSKEFRERRDALGCETAEWPHIPSGCYPN